MKTVLDHIQHDIMSQISDFLNSSENRKWIGNDAIKIYIRKSKRYINNKMIDCFDFATIDVLEPGKGLFTSILKLFEEKYPEKNIYIESVLTERFENYLKRLGFTEINDSKNYYKLAK